MIKYRWILPEESINQPVVSLSRELNLPPPICQILFERGYTTPEDARNFLKPSLSRLHDPFLMLRLDRAVERIVNAIKTGERILIYGDYDVDGVTSIGLLVTYLRQVGGKVNYYIPHRMIEGYGLSKAGLDGALRRGADIIITVDCGITAVDEIKYARTKGVDVIITDHHEQGKSLPEALAVLNPKQEDCLYPEKELCGIGVAFKLCQGVCKAMGLDEEELFQHLDLVAIGIAADIVPMVGENRILAKYGLQKLERTEKIGLRALMKSSGIEGKKLTSSLVVFTLAPRINAVGRIGDAERGAKLLLSDSEEQAEKIAQVLEEENKLRRKIDGQTLEEAKVDYESNYKHKGGWVIVLASESWHPGVIGIVASRMVETYYRPTVLIAIDNEGRGKGSARSIANFHIYDALGKCSEFLESFGGHKYAAGINIRKENVGAFREKLDRVTEETLAEKDLIPELYIDVNANLEEVNEEMLRILNHFAPFGPSNPRPILKVDKLSVVGYPRIVGNNHLKMKVAQDGIRFDTIGFNMGDKLKDINTSRGKIDMAFVLEENEWNGHVSLQGRIKDIRLSKMA